MIFLLPDASKYLQEGGERATPRESSSWLQCRYTRGCRPQAWPGPLYVLKVDQVADGVGDGGVVELVIVDIQDRQLGELVHARGDGALEPGPEDPRLRILRYQPSCSNDPSTLK